MPPSCCSGVENGSSGSSGLGITSSGGSAGLSGLSGKTGLSDWVPKIAQTLESPFSRF